MATTLDRNNIRYILKEAKNLHQESIVVDLHIDPIIQQALFSYHLSNTHAPLAATKKTLALYASQH